MTAEESVIIQEVTYFIIWVIKCHHLSVWEAGLSLELGLNTCVCVCNQDQTGLDLQAHDAEV